jgi:hypothetical protein
MEKVAKVIPTQLSDTPKSRMINGSDGMISPKPMISRSIVRRIIGSESFLKDIDDERVMNKKM